MLVIITHCLFCLKKLMGRSSSRRPEIVHMQKNCFIFRDLQDFILFFLFFFAPHQMTMGSCSQTSRTWGISSSYLWPVASSQHDLYLSPYTPKVWILLEPLLVSELVSLSHVSSKKNDKFLKMEYLVSLLATVSVVALCQTKMLLFVYLDQMNTSD